jgi:CheY-like chemotaxis protein
METEKDSILIVDDNTTNLDIMQAILDKEGYQTTTTDDSSECLEILKTLLPDLILLDISMPGMNGLEVCNFCDRINGQ